MDISILHLSDLHIENKNGTYSNILNNLIIDIQEQCKYLNHIIIVITGDIIDIANYTDENIDIARSFFEELYKKIGSKVVGVEITPGNHDKIRHKINQQLIEENRPFDGILSIDNTDWEYYLIAYKPYLFLANEIRKIFNKNCMKLNNTYYVESIDKIDLKIIFINYDSSWFSFGGKKDERNLRINENQLKFLQECYQKEKQKTDKPYLTIMTGHHPFDWLREKDEAFLSSWLLDSEYFNIDFYLCGHIHDRKIKSFFDTCKSYITLITGVGEGEKNPNERKDKHRYSIYNLNLKNNYCEIIIRKTNDEGEFDYDNDVLLTKEEKENKRIYIPIKSFNNNNPVIKIPTCVNYSLKNEYLFVNNVTLDQIKKINEVFCEISDHMSQFRSMHIRDFFIKYSLNKASKGTKEKQEIYDDYFYRNIENSKVDELFNNIKNYSIIYNNFLSYLRELCGYIVMVLKDKFEYIEFIRLHFRKYYKNEDLYIVFCQAVCENISPPAIRDLDYEKSMVKISFENNTSFVYVHNTVYNPLTISNSKYENFITMAPHIAQNTFQFKSGRKNICRPFITASLSIKCTEWTNILDILNYLDISGFIFNLVYDYVSLFKINMENFILEVNDL